MTTKRNYQKELEEIIEQNKKLGEVPSLVLHSCCAPCSSYVLEYLAQYFKITVFYYNPNIHPDEEYKKRAREQQELIKKMDFINSVDFIEGEFDKGEFHERVKGYEKYPEGGERCFICYRMRLEKTAKVAKQLGIDYFTTTLSISPLKNADKLNEIGEEMAKEIDVKWMPSEFKKKNGYKRSTELSQRYGLYRQNYCGCVYST